jgi:hypothetical protein
MSHNLCLYHKIVQRLVQWREGARITRVRNLALLITGLSLGTGIHLADIVSEWPFASRDLSLVNCLRRFLTNTAVDVEGWYRSVAEQLMAPFAGQCIRLVIDFTKVALVIACWSLESPIASAPCPRFGVCIRARGSIRP